VNIRPLRQSVRPSPIFLLIVALTAVGGALAWLSTNTNRPMAYIGVFIFVVAGWVVTLCLHEFGHAFTAWRFGDHDVPVRGYLTLNPFKYSNPLLSIVLPVLIIAIGGIGLPGGAVWIDHTWIRGRLRDSLISLAGPGMNVAFTGLLVIPFAVGVDGLGHFEFWAAWAFLAWLQLTASLLNLVPIPGVEDRERLCVAVRFPSAAIAAKVVTGAHVDSSKWQAPRYPRPILIAA